MLRRFFKRLLIGAAALAASILVVKVARKILAPKKATEVASEEVAPKDAKPAARPFAAYNLANVIDVGNETVDFAVSIIVDFEKEFPRPIRDPSYDYDGYFDYYADRRWQGMSHEEALQIPSVSEIRLVTPETFEHIDSYQALVSFDGIFDDDFVIPGLHARSVPPLRSKTLKMRTAGTREFYQAYAYLGGQIAHAYLEPIGEEKTTIEEDHAIQCRARLFDLDQPMDIDKWEDEMFNRRVDEDKYLDDCERILVRSPKWLPARHKGILPRLWDQRVLESLLILRGYADGFTDDAKDRFKLHLAALIKTRNRAWGLPGSDVSLYMAPALFRYAASELRRLIWTEESQSLDEEPFSREEIAKEFEYLLNIITIPNPLKGDILRHTPMKVVMALTLDMTPISLG